MSHYEFERKAFDGLSLYFQGWGTEQNPKGVICLLHGLGEYSGRYANLADWLNRAGYSVLSFDLRGHGRSGGLRGHVLSYDEYLQDTDLLVLEAKNRFPNTPCFLYGHSLGAIIVAYYGLSKKPQVGGAILTGLSTKTALQKQKAKILLAKAIGELMPKFTMASGLDPKTISKDPEVVSKYVNDPLVHNKVTVGWGNSTLKTIDSINQHASEWTLPLLVMHGELDQLGYAEGSLEFASKVKADCTVKIWPGLTHEIHNEPEKEQVFEFLRQWLDKHVNV